MLLRLYDVNRSTIQFHEKSLPAQRKSDKCFRTNKELGWFLFFSSELPYKSFSVQHARNNLNGIMRLHLSETQKGVISNLASTIEKFNNDTASLKIKNSIGSITQKMSNA